jgi:hypothetical protein
MNDNAPKNEPAKRKPLPPFEGKLPLWRVPWPSDGPGMFRYMETPGITADERATIEPPSAASIYERYPRLTRDAGEARAPDRKRSR